MPKTLLMFKNLNIMNLEILEIRCSTIRPLIQSKPNVKILEHKENKQLWTNQTEFKLQTPVLIFIGPSVQT